MDPLQQLRSGVLQQIAHGQTAAEILRSFCISLEQMLPGMIVGVTILDRSAQLFEQAVFPSLADDYADALRGIEVADKPGSCALAVYEGKTVIANDVAGDPRFSEAWKTLGLAHGLRALISIPAKHSDGSALGTLVIAFPHGTSLSNSARRLADSAATLCALVLTYRRTQLKHELLVGELQHRVRNLFSTIGAVVYATLRSHPEPDVFRKTFDGRLMALARAHSLALESGEGELRQLLVDTLAPYSIDHEVKVEGPSLVLTQEAAVAFSLAAHELATNAAKYGAFSKEGGSVHIQWRFEQAGNQERFAWTWREAGGPPVQTPSRQGYGQKTISRSIASAFDGKVDLDYRTDGLRCRVSAPRSLRLGTQVN